MARYIDAHKIIYSWQYDHDGITLQSIIDKIPTADVEEVKHGEWELIDEVQFLDGSFSTVFYCSLCHREVVVHHGDEYGAKKALSNKYPYCHCGAKMN